MDTQAYYNRINFNEKAEVSVYCLKKLHEAHVLSIPFENLTVYQKEAVSLKPDHLFEKVVIDKRGGYCFELNGLFAGLLKAIGFDISPHLARVYRDGYAESGKTHRVNTVLIDGKTYLCDVGFGGNGLVKPILVEDHHQEEQNGLIYQITALSHQTFQLETVIDGQLVPLYAFSQEVCIDADFEIANHFTSTYPDSFFLQVLIATRPIKNGRLSLLNREVTIRKGETKDVHVFDGPEAAWHYFVSVNL